MTAPASALDPAPTTPERLAPSELRISVSDPERHGTSAVNAFVDYRLHTTTDLPRFGARDFFVRRRYRDFVWLRERLCHAHPGCIVPPLPTSDSLLKDDRFSASFIQRRQAGLQLFIRRVAGHDRLRESGDLQTFLEAKVWQLQTVKNATGAGGWLSSLFDGSAAEASLKHIQNTFSPKVPDEEAIERMRKFGATYAPVVAAAAAKHHAAVRTHAGVRTNVDRTVRQSQNTHQIRLTARHPSSPVRCTLLSPHVLCMPRPPSTTRPFGPTQVCLGIALG
jgi:hypothetical protein